MPSCSPIRRASAWRFARLDPPAAPPPPDFAGRRFSFLEREGVYWGSPPDDQTAIEELERLRGQGAGFLIVAWPAFWWLDHYSAWRDYMRARFRCVVSDERLIGFDLRPGVLGPPA